MTHRPDSGAETSTGVAHARTAVSASAHRHGEGRDRSTGAAADHPADPTLRRLALTRTGTGRYRAVNVRGGELHLGTGDDEDFTPVELLLAALGGCTAIDVDLITGKRADPDRFEVRVEGHKVRDDGGSHLVDLVVSLTATFPDGEDGDRAREMLPRAIRQSADRICTVGRTLQLGTSIDFRQE